MLPNLEQLKQHLMLPQLLQSAVENGLNYLLSHTANYEYHLRKLNNKTLALNIQNMQIPLFLHFSEQCIDVLGSYESTPDCTVNLAPRLLLNLPNKTQISQFINDKSIELQGDLQVLQDFVTLIEFLEKDPAELLSRYIGDVPAQSAVDFLTKLKAVLQHKINQSQQFWGERLTEEWQVISPRLAIADFCDQVEILAKDTALLEQKINRLIVQMTHITDKQCN